MKKLRLITCDLRANCNVYLLRHGVQNDPLFLLTSAASKRILLLYMATNNETDNVSFIPITMINYCGREKS
ncbi:hypothetical protein T4B_5743 [Trichinella pseudospiralis]|uniref:Uncharacterized protein n=1 Tax=Trichinella pseudospiralis TaxID=6337 RepID=A0A0V1DT72_TRIPS|nr:hypothetical protein T4A_10987 [Trichinella pseudospiralis]KRY69840.1 hypothetical protein T4A_312 [Trichinella pseudospiralis]KRZ00901.1 hypothetical protein T4B_8307 [Trichinella pseudospiralis]KRZ00905.1 hypothetical protein T4B_5743 [Trichinella pseudospiralis]